LRDEKVFLALTADISTAPETRHWLLWVEPHATKRTTPPSNLSAAPLVAEAC
jgi:hypothetical protein